MENEQNKTEVRKYWFFGSKLNTGLLLVLIILMVIALVWMKKDEEKYYSFFDKGYEHTGEEIQELKEDKEIEKEVVKPQVKDTYTYTNHGFSIELLKGYVPEENPNARGTYTEISLSNNSFLTYVTDVQNWENNAGRFEYKGEEKIGETLFKVYYNKSTEGTIYWFKQGKVGYSFVGDKDVLETFKFVGWPIESKTFSTEKFSFKAPSNWTESSVVQRGCPWFSVGAPNNGMVIKGEVGIYPVSCFDLSKQQGDGMEVSQKNGYYIIYYFDDSISKDELKISREAFETIKQSFLLK